MLVRFLWLFLETSSRVKKFLVKLWLVDEPFTPRVTHLSEHSFHVVLIEPEIGANTGNIGRTCVGLNAKLHLVGKLGFSITDRRLKRAGLDYWPHLDFVHHSTWEDWWRTVPDPKRVFFFSTKAKSSLYETQFQNGDWLVFGRETKGLDPEVLEKFSGQLRQIPMTGPIRSLNVATSVAIALFEGFRQVECSSRRI
ncbi:MAG: tRNA (cytidine(34)-2'-O)-methyltransferase [Bdellovibrionaceae bacterium]|nr:tRNA (cytidine(34)-2'-O)-methyltransferase [Pseudobdellovibrionaceae bacterium]